MTLVSPKGKQFTGRHMILCMIGFFGIIIAVNLTMAMLASGSWTGLVVKNSYVASQQYNKQLAGAQAQHDAGYKSSVSYFGGTLVFVLKDSEGSRLSIENPVAEIGRPAFEQEDQILALLPGPERTYRLPVNLAPGDWALKISGSTGGSQYRRDVRMFVDENGKGTVQ